MASVIPGATLYGLDALASGNSRFGKLNELRSIIIISIVDIDITVLMSFQIGILLPKLPDLRSLRELMLNPSLRSQVMVRLLLYLLLISCLCQAHTG